MVVNYNGATIYRVMDGKTKVGGLLVLQSGERLPLDIKGLQQLSAYLKANPSVKLANATVRSDGDIYPLDGARVGDVTLQEWQKHRQQQAAGTQSVQSSVTPEPQVVSDTESQHKPQKPRTSAFFNRLVSGKPRASRIKAVDEEVHDGPHIDFAGFNKKLAMEFTKKYKKEYAARYPTIARQMRFLGSMGSRNNAIIELAASRHGDAAAEALTDLIRDKGFYNSESTGQSVSVRILQEQKDVEVGGDFEERLQALGVAFPALLDLFECVDGVALNAAKYKPRLLSKFNRWLKVKRGSHPTGTGADTATFDHEMGHRLDAAYYIREKPLIAPLYDNRTRAEMTHDLCRYAWDNGWYKKAIESKSISKNDMLRVVSDTEDIGVHAYGEMIAEAWCECMNSKKSRPLASEIGNFMYKEAQLYEGNV